MITGRELKWLMIALMFGVANWFVMAGMRDWWLEKFPGTNTVYVGLIVILGLLFLYRYRGVLNLR